MTSNISIDIVLDRELVKGRVVVTTKTDIRHDGVTVWLEGNVRMCTVSQNSGVFDTLTTSAVKTQSLLSRSQQVSPSERVMSGAIEYPFELDLAAVGANKPLYESYHGNFIAVEYFLRAEMKRSFPNKPMQKLMEIQVENAKGNGGDGAFDSPLVFTITPQTTAVANKAVKPAASDATFKIVGRLTSCSCRLGEPFTGEVTVEHSSSALRRIDLQMYRIETCGSRQSTILVHEKSEILTTQLANGDVCRNLCIPIFLIIPRQHICASVETPSFTIEFECRLVFEFADMRKVFETFPITFHRY